MTPDAHFFYVVVAYLLGLGVVATMIVSILVDYRQLKQALAKFPGRGARSTGRAE